MNFRPMIIAGLALSLAGSALVAWTYLKPKPGLALKPGKPAGFSVVKSQALQVQEPFIPGPQLAAFNTAPIASSPGADSEANLSTEIPHFSPIAGPITQQELLQRAAIVEQEANHDLKHLVSLLDLDQTQQDQIFETLVRRAPAWHPAMQVDSRNPATKPVDPGAPLLDDIEEVLTPDQQQELAENDLNRTEWWAEVIEQLLPTEDVLATAQTDPQSPPGTPPGTAAAAAPPPPDEETSPPSSKEGGDAVIFED